MITLAIIGGRDFSDYNLLRDTIRAYFCSFNEYSESGNNGYEHNFGRIVSGGARGADSLGAQYAREHGIYLTEFLPDWNLHGKHAGFIRNEDIVKAVDVVIAFWDGKSKGTGNSLSIAKRLKKTTVIVYY